MITVVSLFVRVLRQTEDINGSAVGGMSFHSWLMSTIENQASELLLTYHVVFFLLTNNIQARRVSAQLLLVSCQFHVLTTVSSPHNHNPP
jgi:hypothetical protein